MARDLLEVVLLEDVKAVLLTDNLNLRRIPSEELLRRFVCFLVVILASVRELIEQKVPIELYPSE
jgi:hypothetical protein